MMGLLMFKEKLKQVYGRYSLYLTALAKFFMGFLAFWLINSNIGFMTRLKNPLIAVVLGLVASFVPCGVTAFLAGCLAIAHISQVSLEVSLILAVFILVVMMLYYGFKPGDGYLLLLTPILFFCRIPYLIPLFVGLSGSLASVIPVCCGVCVYYTMMYAKQNAGLLAGGSVTEAASRFLQVVQSVFGNELMWVMAAAFAAAILVVYLIKNLSVDYAWPIAIIAGVITQLAVIFVGDFRFDLTIAMVPLIAGVAVSVILAMIYQFFAFAVDYSRTEYLQYEDDEYHYYVKAVPKIAVSEPDVKVHRLNSKTPARRREEH